MVCRLCEKNPVWKFTNQRQLCDVCFVQYFERKVKATIRKHNMPIGAVKGRGLKEKILSKIMKNLPERKGKISTENLDDISLGILNAMMHGDSKKLWRFLPKNQPLYFLSDKEILLYGRINKIKGTMDSRTGKLEEIKNFIKKIEQTNPDIGHNITMALLKKS